jgi:hypothetical protein
MPLYLNLVNLIVQKKSIVNKYQGGLSAFLKDSNWGNIEFDSQDDELLLFAAMNSDEFDFDFFEKAGFVGHEDYFVLTRYASEEKLPDWLQQNNVFLWHSDCPPNQVKLVEKYCKASTDVFFEKQLYLLINSKSIERICKVSPRC